MGGKVPQYLLPWLLLALSMSIIALIAGYFFLR